MESLPTAICIGLILLLFVVPMWAYINITERRARIARDKAIEAGRHEPVTIQPYVDLSVCMGSGACVPACPEDVLKVIDGQALAVNMSACIGHGTCVTACPVGAIELVFGSENRAIDIPRVGSDFQTNVPGVYIAGELGGMGLIANAAEQGVKAIDNIIAGLTPNPEIPSVVIVGAGPAGLAAAAAAKAKGVSFLLLDQDALGGAVRHYPRKKLVFTRTMDIPGYGRVNLKTLHKEELVSLFESIASKLGIETCTGERVDKIAGRNGQFTVITSKRSIQTQRVLLALGRRGTPRKLGVPGEEQEKVAYSLLEPEHYQFDHLMIVGGGDSAVEAALQLSEQPGNKVYLSYRGPTINRPKEKNIQYLKDAVKKGKVELMLESNVKEIGPDRLTIEVKGEQSVIPNDYLFVMVGGVLPTKFLQDVGIKIQKHYGKRVEDVDDAGPQAEAAPPQAEAEKPKLSFITSPIDVNAQFDEPPIHRPKGNEEPTVSLDMSALDPEIAALLAPQAPPREEPEETVPRPEPKVSGLSRLGTASLPADFARSDLGDSVDEVDAVSERPSDAPRRKEVTEIQPLRKVGFDKPIEPPMGAASRESTVLLPDPPADEETTLPRPGESDPARTGSFEQYRVVARKPAPPPEPPPASPLSARLGRPSARNTWTGQVPEPPAPEPEAREERAPTPARPEPRADVRAARPKTGAVQRPAGRSPAASGPGTTSVIQPFIDTVQQLIDSRQHEEALAMCAELRGLVERSSSALAPAAHTEALRGVMLLEGEARLGLGQWASALAPLRSALDGARALGQPEIVGRTLLLLARASHHASEYDTAQDLLDEALGVWTTAPQLERSSALRLLGDLALRRGDVEGAEARFGEALEAARRAGSADAEGRAQRGLANCSAIRGYYPEAIDLLNEALSRMGEGGDPAVVAAILVRTIELENVLGRYGSALTHGERLVEVTRVGHLAQHAAEGIALVGETLVAIGQREDALEAIQQGSALVRKLGERAGEAGLRTARVLCDLGRAKDALAILDLLPQQMPPSLLDDPTAQALALRARALAKIDPAKAKDLAALALDRKPPMLAMRGARVILDAALALYDAGSNSGARSAVKSGLKVLQGSGNKGLKLELLVAMYLASPDHRVAEAAARTAQRVIDDLPSHAVATFRARPVISEALSRWS